MRCLKHPSAKMIIFSDTTGVCESCVNEIAATEEKHGIHFLIEIKKDVYSDQFKKLEEWLKKQQEVSKKSVEWCITKALAIRAVLLGVSIEHILDGIAVSARVDELLI
ncbi:hypothetical protein A2755_00615 [Candidatus Wolfebacteria bacterium RIFCSPHIGHO2_01_FULL_48_22]|uniref:Uncharacterized protein n=2 Tax=Candidatus Wolfeibacteriota TaxID=1752735 RepID=A0A1F8DTD5_9BACT|nr:MAG: hypothetical protein A2755_00615 [Candidatus Wolfebacteria bacterium RIFCSPHIGHO2_01_FULL_48_22]OGM94060.1 MAG: hypothetical protein A2935_02785 [Candidatus Wolfebacteria bacterium RIFCSPLOWO2_01_FULL_47_17b]